MRRLAVLATLLAIPFAAGCGGEDEGGDAGGGETAGQVAQVSATDFAFDPSEITLSAGAATFELTNDGDAPHALEIEGNGFEQESDTIQPGESTRMEVQLEDGTYKIYCPVGDHEDRGMVGTLTVGAGGGSGGGTTGETETGETHPGETHTGETETGETETGETETDGDEGGAY